MKMLVTHNFINMCIIILSVFRWLQVIYQERLSDALSHVLMSVNTSASSYAQVHMQQVMRCHVSVCGIN